MVLCCWQPLATDFTRAIRATPSVQEYLLIGEADSDICGDVELTWGIGTILTQTLQKNESF